MQGTPKWEAGDSLILERPTTAGGAPPPPPPMDPSDQSDRSGKKRNLQEKSIRPFLVHKLLGPRPPPPSTSSLLMLASVGGRRRPPKSVHLRQGVRLRGLVQGHTRWMSSGPKMVDSAIQEKGMRACGLLGGGGGGAEAEGGPAAPLWQIRLLNATLSNIVLNLPVAVCRIAAMLSRFQPRNSPGGHVCSTKAVMFRPFSI